MKTVQLKAHGAAYAQANVTADSNLVKVQVSDLTTRMGLQLEMNPDSAIALARAILEAASQAQFNRLEDLSGKGDAQ